MYKRTESVYILTITHTFDFITWHDNYTSYIPKFGTRGGHTFFIPIAFANMKHCRSQIFAEITKPGFDETCFEFFHT